MSYGDYLEQLTYLIFLKMSDEYAKPPYNRQTGIPAGCNWADMSDLRGAELEEKYKTILETLGEQGGTLGKIFKGATNKINNAAILYRMYTSARAYPNFHACLDILPIVGRYSTN